MSGQIYTEDQCAIQCHFKAKLGEKRNLRMTNSRKFKKKRIGIGIGEI